MVDFFDTAPGLTWPPAVRPQSLDLPWLVAFTTVARDGEGPLDFTAGVARQRRHELEQALAPLTLTWLSLEHGARVVVMDEQSGEVDGADRCGRTDSSDVDSATDADSSSGVDESPACDAAIITQPGTAVAFTTADCLPLVCVSTEEKVAAAIHAGWRGLAAGVIERTVERMTDAGAVRTEGLRVWIGPAIAREDYEVNHDVKDALLARPAITAEHFTPCGTGHFLADLPGAATAIFASLGVPSSAVERCPLSTKSNVFLHSFRRDGAAAGRIATVVGIRRWGEGS